MGIDVGGYSRLRVILLERVGSPRVEVSVCRGGMELVSRKIMM